MSAAVVETDVWIPLRDGVRLSADVFRPDRDGPHPTLLHVAYQDRRNRYSLALVFDPLTAVERGFAVVIADSRGTLRSEGEWSPIRGQAEDGYDAVEWVAAQPWCDGSVGIYGSSGMGVTALRTAVAAPPHLAAAVVVLTGSNYHDGWAYRSGVLELAWSRHWARNMASVKAARVDGAEGEQLRRRMVEITTDPWPLVGQLPVVDDALFPRGLAPWLYEWLEHPEYDDYWRGVDSAGQAERIRVPVLHVAGWYDLFLPGHLALQRALEGHADERVRESSRFVIGPWHHNTYLGYRPTTAGARDFGPGADSTQRWYAPLVLDWFDTWLKRRPAPAGPRVRYFQMGENVWREDERWPPPSTPLELYLRSGGRANSRAGDGALAEAPPAGDEPVDGYRYDPLDPVPTVGGSTLSHQLTSEGVQDQAAVETREDVLVYTGPLLTRELRIAGPLGVVLYASTSAVDTDFTAKLVDVEPAGFCANIAEGIVRARYRNGVEQAELLEPGEVYELHVRLNDVAHTFRAGHRVRLEISSSSFPRFGRNLNVATHPNRATAAEAEVATQQVHHTAARPSRLTLPVPTF